MSGSLISFSRTRGFPILLLLVGISTASSHEPEVQLPFAHPHSHGSLDGHLHVGWESRYFSEGRDALDGDSLFASSIEMGWKHLVGGIWYGNSPDQRYDELQLTLALSQTLGDFEFYAGYTHFRFPFDDSFDNEVGAGVVWLGLPMEIELGADGYYSFDASGYFVEFAAAREFAITEQLTLSASSTLGINQGYVSDGHDGANHMALRLGVAYAVSDAVSLTVHAAYSWELGRDRGRPGDDQLIDFFHGGLGLQWSF